MKRLRALTFAAALLTWTYLLLIPKPVPEIVRDGINWFDWETLHYLVAKAAHVGVYATLAAWGGSLFPAGRRWPLYAALVLHGVATEVGQMFVPNRYGCVPDMLIDSAGVAIGALLLARYGPGAVRENDIPDEAPVTAG